MRESGGYWAIVEHESEASFMAMHTSPERAKAWAKVESLLVGRPSPLATVRLTRGRIALVLLGFAALAVGTLFVEAFRNGLGAIADGGASRARLRA